MGSRIRTGAALIASGGGLPGDWTAVILAGGRARRLGGVDKATVSINGRPLIDIVIDGLGHTAGLPAPTRIIVVGPTPADRPRPHIDVMREEPPFGGPVAAIGAAIDAVHTSWIGIAAVDMPHTATLLARLHAAIPEFPATGVVAADEDARLTATAFLRTDAVRERLTELTASGGLPGRPLRTLLELDGVVQVVFRAPDQSLLADIDSPADLERRWDVSAPPTDQPKLTP